MKILVFGSSGLLGSELVSQLKKTSGFETVTNDFATGGIDITDEKAVKELVNEIKPEAIVNCAAFTNVEACEEEDQYDLALNINGKAPGILAKTAKDNNSIFVHISTDYIFNDNDMDGYKEDYDNFNPMNKYGATKLEGENSIKEVCSGTKGSDFIDEECNSYIIRTQWLFGKGANNFIAKILNFAKEKDFLQVVTDEVGCPTYVKDLAEQIITILKERPKPGIYHVAGRGSCSRNEFAKAILKYAKIGKEVRDAKLADWPRKSHIANYSILLNTKLPKLRKWEAMVKDYIENDLPKEND